MKRLALVTGVTAALILTVPDINVFAAPDSAVSKIDAKSSAMSFVDAQVSPPETVEETLGSVKNAVSAAKTGKWWYFSALAITILLFLLKFVGKKVGFWPKLGRWRYVLAPVLSIVAALLAAFQGGVSLDVALGVFTSSYATSSLQELYEHGILGKPRASSSSV